jgi:superfamily II DNA or RNA helicase
LTSDRIFIGKHNEVYNFVTGTNPGIEFDLSDHFTFKVPGAHFMPAYKNGIWDGKIRLYNKKNNLIYSGLFENIKKFAEKNNYILEYDEEIFGDENFTEADAQAHIEALKLPYVPYEYQLKAFVDAIRKRKQTIVSATGTGKSLMIYLIATYLNLKTLVITPRTNLVDQLADDFRDYGFKGDIHKINVTKEKDSDINLNFTTWHSIQSMTRLPNKWYEQFECVIVDEVHGAKAKELTKILEKTVNAKYRVGLTGTLDGHDCNRLIIEGLLGPVNIVARAQEQIEKNRLNPVEIKIIILGYSEEAKKAVKTMTYQEEIDFILNHEGRNTFLVNLISKMKGNSVSLFGRIKHSKDVHAKICKTKHAYYVSGEVSGTKRNKIRRVIENDSDATIIAIDKVFSEGINITSLKNILFAHPKKARIQTLQAIGRALRKHKTKGTSVIYDIADDFSIKTRKNYTLKHLSERIKYYRQEKFPYKVYNVRIE